MDSKSIKGKVDIYPEEEIEILKEYVYRGIGDKVLILVLGKRSERKNQIFCKDYEEYTRWTIGRFAI